MVEEVPSHEIYASLLGIQRKPLLSVSSCPKNSPGATVIPIEEAEIPRSSFGQAYQRAQETKFSSLAIQPSNKGFKLLEKMGWKECEGGLGRNRQGSLLPVKTMLKDDKKGLGASPRKRARVTHRRKGKKGNNTPQETKKLPHETKAQRKWRLRTEREKQHNDAKKIRLMLRTDVGDEYEKLYRQLH